MTVEDEILADARRLFGPQTDWVLHIERDDERHRLLLHAEHPASSGMILDIDLSSPRMAEHLEWFAREREVSIANAAPPLVHPDIVMGVQALARAYEWPANEVRGVAFLLHEASALTVEETSWLAGYLAEDAPMEPVSPLGP
jgi:hypothetical protein